MSELLRDPMWQFIVGILIAIAAILVTVIVYLKQRTRKSLSYEIVSLNPLLSVEKEIKNDLQILYHGKPVSQVHLIVVRITNSGNIPILSTDYERPVSLSFGENAQILTAEITQKNPGSLQPSVKANENNVVLTPILLNQGDSVTLKTLVTGFSKVTVDGRVIGVKEIKEFTQKQVRYLLLAGVGIAVEFIGGAFLPSPLSGLISLFGAGIAIFALTRSVRSIRSRLMK